ncbi:MAG: hypothetical protein HRU25_02695 [Psychrobium sp.]|nr:hypothetical protein [Psychrobium sp.]
MVKVSQRELSFALDASTFMSSDDIEAFVCTKTGKVWVAGLDDVTGEEEALPDDLYSNEQYILLPDKRDLDLGRDLVMQFVNEFLPDEIERVYGYFRRSGAYGHYKALLQTNELLDEWHQFEEQQVDKALRDWCAENNLQMEE